MSSFFCDKINGPRSIQSISCNVCGMYFVYNTFFQSVITPFLQWFYVKIMDYKNIPLREKIWKNTGLRISNLGSEITLNQPKKKGICEASCCA